MSCGFEVAAKPLGLSRNRKIRVRPQLEVDA